MQRGAGRGRHRGRADAVLALGPARRRQAGAAASSTPFTGGEVEVQDEGSQLLALLTDAKRGEMVVDFCAGAGGKTLALGAAMRNTGRLYAFDVSGHRLDALKPRLARSGLSNVHPAQIAHERDERIKRLAGKIDRVLVDAPCSGLGTLRRNPDLKWRQSPQAVAELQAKQTGDPGQRGAAAEARRAAGLRHLQPAGAPRTRTVVDAFDARSRPRLRAAAGRRGCCASRGVRARRRTGRRRRYLRLWPHRARHRRLLRRGLAAALSIGVDRRVCVERLRPAAHCRGRRARGQRPSAEVRPSTMQPSLMVAQGGMTR
ncbi:MAG: RsmB/NOP family class I SAM-dependent RNA methyltransferase [Comamonadaceae bacterium]|nr:RsmB/NOP family class I SAM-dependent RNA methyltransferase [Comamonadaceae bacterium]